MAWQKWKCTFIYHSANYLLLIQILGTVFDSSRQKKRTFKFPLGEGKVPSPKQVSMLEREGSNIYIFYMHEFNSEGNRYGTKIDVHSYLYCSFLHVDSIFLICFLSKLSNFFSSSALHSSANISPFPSLVLSILLLHAQVIKGWDEGVASMKVGERAVLYLPASYGYC